MVKKWSDIESCDLSNYMFLMIKHECDYHHMHNDAVHAVNVKGYQCVFNFNLLQMTVNLQWQKKTNVIISDFSTKCKYLSKYGDALYTGSSEKLN